jgi:hypothetical protein
VAVCVSGAGEGPGEGREVALVCIDCGARHAAGEDDGALRDVGEWMPAGNLALVV